MADSTWLEHLFHSKRAIDLISERLEEWRAGGEEWRAKEQERILNLKIRCDECKAVFKFLDRQSLKVPWHTKFYCPDCFLKVKRKYTYICHKCGGEYIYRQERNFCDQCRIYNHKAQSDLIQRHKRKSRLKGLPADLELYDWLYTVRHFNGKCAYCQKEPYQELDHFNPQGGTTRKNCVPACYECNHDKIDFDPIYPPVHLGTNYIDWIAVQILTPNMNVPLLEGIKRVAAYLMVPFPHEVSDRWPHIPQNITARQ